LEDLRNEVFVRLFDKGCKKLRQYRPGAGLGLAGWIKLIAGQTVKMYLRKKDRHGTLGDNKLLSADELIQEIGGKAPEGQLEAREKLRQVAEMLETFPHQERLVLKLHFFDGLTLEQIANFTHKKIGNVYAIKSRGLKRLREVLGVKC
jgi:RNA polymerase sigma factor (sigma-70 family)